MVNWKEIHSNFTPELQKQWEESGFGYDEVEKWISIVGINPHEYEFATFAKKLEYSIESILDIGVENLWVIYRENLQAQMPPLYYGQENMIDPAIQKRTEFLSQLEEAAGEGEEDNGGLLTCDNLTFILENDREIKEAREREKDKIQVRTDIVDINSQLERVKKGEIIEEGFWNSLENGNQKHTIFPLRVNDKHWGLLIIINNPYYPGLISEINYLSLSPFHQQELDEIKSFLGQLEVKFKVENINKSDLSEVISVPFNEDNKQNDTCDCGVFCCLVTRFLCFDNFVNLDTDEYQITSKHTGGFRKIWKRKIGEENWCKWEEKLEKTDMLENFEKREAGETKENSSLVIKELEKRLEKSEKEKKLWQEECQKVNQKYEELQERLLTLAQKWMEEIQQEIGEEELVIEFWKAQEELKQGNNTHTWNKLKDQEKRILEKISADKLRRLCQLKSEITKLEEQKKQFEAKIEFNQKK